MGVERLDASTPSFRGVVFIQNCRCLSVVKDSGGLMTLGTDERDLLSTSDPASRRVADAEVQIWRQTTANDRVHPGK